MNVRWGERPVSSLFFRLRRGAMFSRQKSFLQCTFSVDFLWRPLCHLNNNFPTFWLLKRQLQWLLNSEGINKSVESYREIANHFWQRQSTGLWDTWKQEMCERGGLYMAERNKYIASTDLTTLLSLMLSLANAGREDGCHKPPTSNWNA